MIREGGPGATEAALAGTLAARLAFACPGEGRWLLVPARHGLVEPATQLGLGLRMLPCQRPCDEDALHRLGHIQPRPGERRVQGPDPVLEEPDDQLRSVVSGEVVPHQQEPQRRQGRAGRMAEPMLPAAQRRAGCWGQWREGIKNRQQSLLAPRVQHGVRRIGHAFRPHGPRRRVEERQQFGGPAPQVLVRQAWRLAPRRPALPRLGDGLVRPGFISTPD